VSLILGLFTVAAAFAGHYLSRRGKRDEIRQQQVAQAFEERNTAFEQVSALADRYKGDADRERDLRQRDNDAWEARWSRQMDRCRLITDTASNTITDLMKFVPLSQQRDAGRVLDDMAEHRAEDH
jgi:vacuolar-type H+-ATPase subunit I/STV1